MAKAKKKKTDPGSTIALNKKARFEYQLEDRFEAGMSLLGWEVKALRARRINLAEGYIMLKAGEVFLFGASIQPLSSASTHIRTDPLRTRKLLLNAREIRHLIGSVERKGYALIPTAMYWKKGRVKLEIALARGKKLHDKRADDRDRDWGRDKQRILKSGS